MERWPLEPREELGDRADLSPVQSGTAFFLFFFHVFFILVIEYLVEVCLIVIVLFHAYTYILPEEDTGLKQLSSISVTEWVQRLKTNNLFYGALQSGAYFWGGPPPAPPHKHN